VTWHALMQTEGLHATIFGLPGPCIGCTGLLDNSPTFVAVEVPWPVAPQHHSHLRCEYSAQAKGSAGNVPSAHVLQGSAAHLRWCRVKPGPNSDCATAVATGREECEDTAAISRARSVHHVAASASGRTAGSANPMNKFSTAVLFTEQVPNVTVWDGRVPGPAGSQNAC
jgi:hypothetical protein